MNEKDEIIKITNKEIEEVNKQILDKKSKNDLILKEKDSKISQMQKDKEELDIKLNQLQKLVDSVKNDNDSLNKQI
jgi:hypothetical protein